MPAYPNAAEEAKVHPHSHLGRAREDADLSRQLCRLREDVKPLIRVCLALFADFEAAAALAYVRQIIADHPELAPGSSATPNPRLSTSSASEQGPTARK